MPLSLFLQNIDVHVHEKVLRFRGDLHFTFIWLWKSLEKFMICNIIDGILCVAQGHGAKGQNEYEFSLEFILPVKAEVCI